MKKLAERLQYFNEWRRGAKTKMPNTTQIGLDIDSAIIIINQYKQKQDEISKLNERESETKSILIKMFNRSPIACDGMLLVKASDYDKLVTHLNNEEN